MKTGYKIIIVCFIICFIQSACNKDKNGPAAGSGPCLSDITGSTLDIVTWNVHDFPYQGEESLSDLAGLIKNLDAEVIALQEITGLSSFAGLLEKLPGYNGLINAYSDLNLAFLVKKNIGIHEERARILFENDPYIFPRPPLRIALEVFPGIEIYLINIHLKCCEGAENHSRRAEALKRLKKYVDDSLSAERVIILGDFNGMPEPDKSTDIFSGFIADSLNYLLTDEPILQGDPASWSFPSWPGHLDHILVTNELFGYDFSVQCLLPDLCDSLYFTRVSDHRPVLIRFRL